MTERMRRLARLSRRLPGLVHTLNSICHAPRSLCMDVSAYMASTRSGSSVTMPLMAAVSRSSSNSSQKWSAYVRNRSAMASRLAASAGGKHSDSSAASASRSLISACRIICMASL